MGWFLTKNKPAPRTRSRTRAGQRSVEPRWDPQRTLLGLKLVGAVALVVGLMVGWRYAEWGLRSYVSDLNEQRRDPQITVELVDAPAWMSPLLYRDLCQLAAAQIRPDPLNAQRLDWAREALAANPWVKAVQRIERLPADTVRVQAVYRQPAALVETPDGYHLVDREGVCLPGLYLKHQLRELALPVIVGASAMPQRPGQPWPGRDFQAGLDLALLLVQEPYLDQVQSIDVSYRDERNRIRLVLHTVGGGLVRWGLPVGDEHPIEPPSATKRAWLTGLYHQRGSIDAGGKVVDVFGPAVFVRQPLNPAIVETAQAVSYQTPR